MQCVTKEAFLKSTKNITRFLATKLSILPLEIILTALGSADAFYPNVSRTEFAINFQSCRFVLDFTLSASHEGLGRMLSPGK